MSIKTNAGVQDESVKKDQSKAAPAPIADIIGANPAPLGLLAFGMTTVLLNIHNAGLYTLDAMILAMGIFYGGIAQIFAGLLEWRMKNVFGMTAFCSYGLFWLTLVALLVIPKTSWGANFVVSENAMISYFLVWGAFTGLMFVGTLKINRALQVVFASLTILFVLLAIRDITGNTVIGRIAGWEGIFTGLSAVYAGMAQIWNATHGKTVLSLGPVNK